MPASIPLNALKPINVQLLAPRTGVWHRRDPEEVRGAGVRHGRRARVGGGVNSHPYLIEDEDENRDKKEEDKI